MTTRGSIVCAVIAGACALLTGCGKSSSSSGPAAKAIPPRPPAPIVSVDWVGGVNGREGVVLIDTRSAEEYQAGHIPGAVSLPRTATYDKTEGRAQFPAPVPQIEALFGSVGVDMDTTVVLYDDKNYRDAARVFWVLEVHGHPSVAVLNGGL
jgi:thiosulfate/3-mercaptopyruvate sulfurtransferase